MERASHHVVNESVQEEDMRRVTCFLVDCEGRRHSVPKVWRGACRDEVMRKMLHVRAWVPFIVEKVIEVAVEG